jgi:hypothetical protein
MTDKSQYISQGNLDSGSLLITVQEVFNKEVNTQLNVFFDSLKGILFVFEQNSKSDYKQSLNYSALKLLINQKEKIAKNTLSTINTAFKYFQQSDYDFFINDNLNISNYQKIKLRVNEEDEMAIVTQLINKSEEANEKDLHHLSNKFSELASGKDLTFNQIPVSPFVVVNSLVNSIKELDLNTGVRMIVYNAFEVNVILKLKRIYPILIKMLKPQFSKYKDTKKSLSQDKTIDVKFTIIQQILNRYHKNKKNEPSQKQHISKDLTIQTLNILQEKLQKKYAADENYLLNPSDLKNILSKNIVKLYKNAKKLNFTHSDSDTIYLVSLLFQYISKDNSIQDQLKHLLLRLQIPILKIALQEIDLFKYTTNPVRLLLNQISYIPDGFNDNLDTSNKYLIKLKEIVAVVLVQSSYKMSLYQNLLIELNEFSEKKKKKFKLIQKRIKEKAVGLEKIITVKAHVLSLLEKLMHDRYMPVYIKDLILQTWKNVLVIEFLRHPEESKTCQAKLGFVETLLDYCRAANNKKVNLGDIKKIVLQYSEGLDLVAFNSKDLLDKNNELLSFLLQVHGIGKESGHVDNIIFEKQHSDVIMYFKKEENFNDKTNENSQVIDQYFERSKALKVGDWLEFKNEKLKPYRAKISWISPMTGKYLLVNSNGVRSSDKTINEIAEGFKNKTCHELKTIPLVDRALLDIAKIMNEKLKI